MFSTFVVLAKMCPQPLRPAGVAAPAERHIQGPVPRRRTKQRTGSG